MLQASRSGSIDNESLAETDITEATATTETTLVETNFCDLQVSWLIKSYSVLLNIFVH